MRVTHTPTAPPTSAQTKPSSPNPGPTSGYWALHSSRPSVVRACAGAYVPSPHLRRERRFFPHETVFDGWGPPRLKSETCVRALISCGSPSLVSPTTTILKKKKKKKPSQLPHSEYKSRGVLACARLLTHADAWKKRTKNSSVPFAPPKRASIKASGCCFGALTGRRLPLPTFSSALFSCVIGNNSFCRRPSPRRSYASAHHRRHWMSWSICV